LVWTGRQNKPAQAAREELFEDEPDHRARLCSHDLDSTIELEEADEAGHDGTNYRTSQKKPIRG
jgi:hypothetical protein